LSIDESFVDRAAYIEGRYMVIPEAVIPITDRRDRRSDVTHDIVSVWNGRFFRLEDGEAGQRLAWDPRR
jgi:branched-chain amino acid aminotransferase